MTTVFPPEITEEFIYWKQVLKQEDLRQCLLYFQKRGLQDEVDLLSTPQAWNAYHTLKGLIDRANKQQRPVVTSVDSSDRKLAHLICEGFGLISLHRRHASFMLRGHDDEGYFWVNDGKGNLVQRYMEEWESFQDHHTCFIIGKHVSKYDRLVSNKMKRTKTKIRLDRLQRTTLPNPHQIRLQMGPPTDSHFLQLCQDF